MVWALWPPVWPNTQIATMWRCGYVHLRQRTPCHLLDACPSPTPVIRMRLCFRAAYALHLFSLGGRRDKIMGRMDGPLSRCQQACGFCHLIRLACSVVGAARVRIATREKEATQVPLSLAPLVLVLRIISDCISRSLPATLVLSCGPPHFDTGQSAQYHIHNPMRPCHSPQEAR